MPLHTGSKRAARVKTVSAALWLEWRYVADPVAQHTAGRSPPLLHAWVRLRYKNTNIFFVWEKNGRVGGVESRARAEVERSTVAEVAQTCGQASTLSWQPFFPLFARIDSH